MKAGVISILVMFIREISMKKLASAFFICFLLLACSSDNSSGAKIEKNESSECTKPLLECLGDQDTLSPYDYEFAVNYLLLKYNYLYAAEEVGDAEEYYGLGSGMNTEFGNTYAMYQKMSSAYTYYIPPELVEYFYVNYLGQESMVGIGIQVSEALEITQVYADGPAEKGGILRGDTVKSIDDVPIVKRESLERLLKGDIGDKVTLGIARGDSTFEVSLTFSEIVLPTVFLDSVQGVPRIRITSFETETAGGLSTSKEFENALKESDGAKTSIIDLRGNTGGVIDECLAVSEMLLGKDDTLMFIDVVMYNEAIDSQMIVRETLMTETDGVGKGRYYVFLADSGTGSCSEFFLLAATSNMQSPIIGRNTYGKAIGQQIEQGEITYGISVIVASMMYGKDGETYHAKGFVPDYETDDEEEAFAKALEFIEVEQRREAGYGKENMQKFLKKEHNSKAIGDLGMYKIVNVDTIPWIKNKLKKK